MEVNGNFDFKGAGKLIRPGVVASDFPSSPSIGELVLKDKRVYICVDIINGLPCWVNLVNELSMYRHDQQTPAMEWVIAHGMNVNYALVQVYDANGFQLIPDSINCSTQNQTTVAFNMPVAGVALVTTGDMYGQPRPNLAFTNDYTSSTTWVVQHNLGYNPSITVIVGNYVVQPESIVHNSVNQATITFSFASAGSVRCV